MSLISRELGNYHLQVPQDIKVKLSTEVAESLWVKQLGVSPQVSSITGPGP